MEWNGFVGNNTMEIDSSGTFKSISISTTAHSPVTPTMPTERYAREYNMKHKNRGLALIFNHETFDSTFLLKREGTNVDCEKLAEVLKDLQFNVKIFKDCGLSKLIQHIEWAAQENHSDNDCILVAILTHGEMGSMYTKDFPYNLDIIMNYFTADKCPTLAGKPKLFLIECSQGVAFRGGNRAELDRGQTLIAKNPSKTFTIPTFADFLIALSTPPGFASWRNPSTGSWFTQELCKELKQNGKTKDILTLLTSVCQHVAFDYESYGFDDQFNKLKQIPCITTMLTRTLRFNDKINFVIN